MVSLSDSPLSTDEPGGLERHGVGREPLGGELEGRRRCASSDSKKTLTTVRPRSVGTFLTSRASTASNAAAVSRMRSTSSRPQVGDIEIRWRLARPSAGAILRAHSSARHLVDLVGLHQPHRRPARRARSAGSCPRSRRGSAARGGRGRRAPPAARGRAAVVEQRVDGGADGAAGVEHVVDQHDGAAVDREVERALTTGCDGPGSRRERHVVAVEGDVERADAGSTPVVCAISRRRRCATRTPRV